MGRARVESQYRCVHMGGAKAGSWLCGQGVVATYLVVAGCDGGGWMDT